MQSLVLTRDGLHLADTPMPPVMPGNVRIEVRSVGICDTDVAIWNGEYETKLPLVLGHEIAGMVHESSVSDITPGTAVTTETGIGCGRCWYCRNGKQYYCADKQILGLTRDGGMTEYLSVPADIVHKLPFGMDSTISTFAEPLASALHTNQNAPTKDDEPVLILGCGELGLLLAQVYDAYGSEVFIVGSNRWKLGIARQLGMRNTLNWETKDWKKKILDATNGVGPRVVIDSIGSEEALQNALDIVRSEGIIAFKRSHINRVSIPTKQIVRKGLTVVGGSHGMYEEAIDMLRTGRIEVQRLVSKEFKLEEGQKAFEYASDPSVAKVIINI
ncbi:MAG: alcohol dehydrogenase catalytic domain-containing protein [Candidatus Thorarchaeota archaeon]